MANYKKYKRTGHSGHYWEFRAYLGLDSNTGKEVRISRRRDGINNNPFKTKREAMDEVARLKAQFIEGGKKKKEKEKIGYTFGEVYKEWLDKRYATTVRESTLAKTQGYFDRYILPEFEDKYINELTIDYCDAVVNRWLASGRLTDYSEIIQYVVRVLDYSIYVGYSKENPMDKVHIPARTTNTNNNNSKEIEFLDRDELVEFLDECKRYGRNDKWYTFFRLVSYTGCRKSEALALEWNDINWKNKEITFNKTLSKVSRGVDEANKVVLNDSTKNGRSRTVSIDDKTLKVLNEYKDINNSHMMFPATNKIDYTHPDLPNTVMKRILDRTDIDKNITPHGLRHTHASLLFEAGLNVKDVQNRLGHSSSSVTMDVYTHVSSGRERLAADMFSNYLKKTPY